MTTPDLQRALDALNAKQKPYADLWDYYDGDQPLRFSSKRLAEIFKGEHVRFAQNWAAVVINSALDRIQFKGLAVKEDDEATRTLEALIDDTELKLDADDVHKAALVCGEAFVVVWPEEEGGGSGAVDAYYHDPRLCHLFYRPDRPRQKAYGAKWWRDDADYWHVTLYYPDHLEYWQTAQALRSKTRNDAVVRFPDKASAFVPTAPYTVEAWPENPFGEVPVFHFRPDRRVVKSLLKDVIAVQDALNKLFSDMMVSAEFGAFKQRYFVTNADLRQVKSAPDEVLVVPAGDPLSEGTKVGEFSATELKNYLDAMVNLAESIAAITSTPRHLFFGLGGTPSGEALIAMEAPLNRKCEQLIERFTPTWKKVGAFLLQVAASREMQAGAVAVNFARPQTVQPRTEAEIRQIEVSTGLPLKTVLRREGWTEQEIAELEADMAEERKQKEEQQAQATLTAIRAFQAQSQPNGGNGAPGMNVPQPERKPVF